jgi:hypothetical protein
MHQTQKSTVKYQFGVVILLPLKSTQLLTLQMEVYSVEVELMAQYTVLLVHFFAKNVEH